MFALPPWIVDSGASFHAISRAQAEREGATEFRATDPIELETANGNIPSNEEVHIFIPQLKCWLWARILPSSPKLLSLGNLCSKLGFHFGWKGYTDKPALYFPQAPLHARDGV